MSPTQDESILQCDVNVNTNNSVVDSDVSLNSSDLSLSTDGLSSITSTGIVVKQSTDVQIGSRLHYNAPVTINQYVTTAASTPYELAQNAYKAPYHSYQGGGEEVVTTIHTESVKTSLVEKKGVNILCRRRSLWSWMLILAIGFLVALGVGIFVFTSTTSSTPSSTTSPTIPTTLASNDKPRETTTPVSTKVTQPSVDSGDANTTLSDGRHIISKSDWGGYPTLLDRPHWKLEHPTPYVLITHTGGNTCYNPNTCSTECRNIQNENVGGQYEMADIAINFLVGGDGNIYEGRGWDLTNPFRGFTYLKRHNLAIAFMGNYVVDKPTSVQINSTLALIDLGIQLGKLDPSYKLLAHNETTPTISPGRNIYFVIKDWPHFWIPA